MEFVTQDHGRSKSIGYTIGDKAEQVAVWIESIQHNLSSNSMTKQSK